MRNMISEKSTKKKIFELTLAIYRVTDRFPKEEALRHQIREAASLILEDFVFYITLRARNVVGKRDELMKVSARIKALLSLFQIARSQNFVSELNFDILEWEYNQMFEACESELAHTHDERETSRSRGEGSVEEGIRKITAGFRPKESIGEVIENLTDRQKYVLGVLKNNGKTARLKEIVQHFPGLSEKTVRNDLKVLCEKNLLSLNGRAPQSYYTIR